MFDRLRNNWGVKLLSLFIAIVAWGYLRLTPNPVIAAHFVQQVTVPITTTGLPPEEIAQYTDRLATVAVDVGRGGNAIRPEMVRAVLNLEGRAPGVYNIPVEVIAPKLEIRSLSPASVTLQIEKIERRSVSVALHYVGTLRHNVVVSGTAIEPSSAIIDGQSSALARVASVRVDVPLPQSPANFDAMVRPIAIDASGNEVPQIAVQPNLVRVRVGFAAPKK